MGVAATDRRDRRGRQVERRVGTAAREAKTRASRQATALARQPQWRERRRRLRSAPAAQLGGSRNSRVPAIAISVSSASPGTSASPVSRPNAGSRIARLGGRRRKQGRRARQLGKATGDAHARMDVPAQRVAAAGQAGAWQPSGGNGCGSAATRMSQSAGGSPACVSWLPRTSTMSSTRLRAAPRAERARRAHRHVRSPRAGKSPEHAQRRRPVRAISADSRARSFAVAPRGNECRRRETLRPCRVHVRDEQRAPAGPVQRPFGVQFHRCPTIIDSAPSSDRRNSRWKKIGGERHRGVIGRARRCAGQVPVHTSPTF